MAELRRRGSLAGATILAATGWTILCGCDGAAGDTGKPEPELTWVRYDAADVVLTPGRAAWTFTQMYTSPQQVMRGPGDVTGDGIPDVVIAALDGLPAVVVDGPLYGHRDITTGIPLMIPDLVYLEPNSVAWNGDIDGDGIHDVFLATSTYSPAALVYLGPALEPRFMSEADATFDVETDEEDLAYQDVGRRAIDSGHDINGDGLDDLLIGDRKGNSFGSTTQDSVFVFFGGRAAQGAWTAEDADLIVTGDGDTDSAGQYGAILSDDITGDGRADLVITADRAGQDAPTSFGFWTEQMVVILEGGDSGLQSLADRFGSIMGIEHGDGDNVGLTSGDVDGDGLADVFVSTPQWEDGDAIYLFHGPIEGDQDAATSAAWTFADKDVFEQPYLHVMAGTSLDVAGDIDADGTPDLLISVEDWSGITNLYGYTTWGQGMGFACTRYDAGCQDVETADIRFLGNWDSFGEHMVHLGDVSGDGFDDFMVMAHRADGLVEHTSMGEAFIYYGGPDAVERLMGEPP